jgi:hypothetical protein
MAEPMAEGEGQDGLPDLADYDRTLAKKGSIKRRLDDYFDKRWDENADVRGLDALLKRMDIALREFERPEVRVSVTGDLESQQPQHDVRMRCSDK